MKARDPLLLLLFVLHPLVLVGNLADLSFLGATVAQMSGSILWAVELVVFAAAFQHLSFAMAWPFRTATVPMGVDLTPSGFSIALSGSRSIAVFLFRALIGTAASTVGIGILSALAFQLAIGPIPPVSLLFFVLVNGILHASAALVVSTLAAVVRWRAQRPVQVELQGRVLRTGGRSLTLDGPPDLQHREDALLVSSGRDTLRIPGPPHILNWMAERLASTAATGSASDVPRALQAVREPGTLGS